MNINKGFKIDNPDVFIPWGIDESELVSILGKQLRYVTHGYYVLTSCESLGGLKHELGFHFEPRKGGNLHELEFFRRSYPNQQASFEEFQKYFEKEFGPPTVTTPGSENFPNHEWRLKEVTIVHYVFDRFGPEEHMEIRRN